MQFSSSLLENAVNEFAKLPGIGKKTALRLVLQLLKTEPGKVTAGELFETVIAKIAAKEPIGMAGTVDERQEPPARLEHASGLLERLD